MCEPTRWERATRQISKRLKAIKETQKFLKKSIRMRGEVIDYAGGVD